MNILWVLYSYIGFLFVFERLMDLLHRGEVAGVRDLEDAVRRGLASAGDETALSLDTAWTRECTPSFTSHDINSVSSPSHL